jgi:hypothetical protein
MKKELVIHFSFLASFLLLVSVFRGWFSLSYIPLWLGGILGTLLPDVDHLIYAYFLRPQEVTSQRVNYLLQRGQIKRTLELLHATREERGGLIFHSAHFQLIFLALTFLVLTSSGSIFGAGLVLAFSLHLLIDQIIDFTKLGSLRNWFTKILIDLDKDQQRWYVLAIGAAILIFGFLL